MKSRIVRIDMQQVMDWDSFHQVFQQTLRFPDFYGRNMDAWIDCLSYLDQSDAGMSKIDANPRGVVALHLENVTDFALRCPEIYQAVIECSALANCRRIEQGDEPVLALSF